MEGFGLISTCCNSRSALARLLPLTTLAAIFERPPPPPGSIVVSQGCVSLANHQVGAWGNRWESKLSSGLASKSRRVYYSKPVVLIDLGIAFGVYVCQLSRSCNLCGLRIMDGAASINFIVIHAGFRSRECRFSGGGMKDL